MKQELTDELQKAERLERRTGAFAWSALAFAFLQRVCTAVIAASGMRFAMGLGALITSIATSAPAQDIHVDTIRLPILTFSLVGAAVNLRYSGRYVGFVAVHRLSGGSNRCP